MPIQGPSAADGGEAGLEPTSFVGGNLGSSTGIMETKMETTIQGLGLGV